MPLFRMPREDAFFADLGHLAEAASAAAALLVETLADLDPDGSREHRIKDLEHAGDRAVDTLMERLDRTFVTPLDREDLHDLAVSLDGVLNRIDRIAHRIRLYRVTSVREGARSLGDLIRKSAATLVDAVRELGEKGRHAHVLTLCDAVDAMEHDGDVAADTALAELFHGPTDPIEIIKWKDLVEDLEKATDKCKTVAGVLRRIVIKNA